MPGDILNTIDNALADCTSDDAMRWRPEGTEEPELPIPAMWPPMMWGPGADPLDIYPGSFTGTLPGDVMTIDGQRYRVTAVTRDHGVYTFDCEPAD